MIEKTSRNKQFSLRKSRPRNALNSIELSNLSEGMGVSDPEIPRDRGVAPVYLGIRATDSLEKFVEAMKRALDAFPLGKRDVFQLQK